MQPLTSKDVQKALEAFNITVEMTFFDESTATSQLAAEQIGCELGQIVKSLCFMIAERPVLVMASGDIMVDTRKLATLLNVSNRKTKIARPEECIQYFGYVPGGVPPVGHRDASLSKYLDTSLKRYDTLYAAGGAHNAIFKVSQADLVEMTRAEWVDVRRDD